MYSKVGIGKTWTWITGSLDTVKYGLLLIALHRLDLALPKTDWEIGS
jgi:hypothetical protein